MEQTKQQSESIVVRLDSETSEVNAEAVASSMSAIIALINEAQDGVTENQQLLIKARPFAEGSFEIPLDLIVLATAALFDNSHLIESVLDTLKKYFDVKAALKGKPAPKDETATVVIDGRDVTIGSIVLNMIQPGSEANRKVDQAMQQVESDTSIENVEVLRGLNRERIIQVQRTEIASYRISEAKEVMAEARDKESREKLYIVAPVFQGKAMWKFNRAGNIISAHIDDEQFEARVAEGAEVFAAGDQLDVDLSVHQLLDKATNSYINKKYTVQHVWGHEKRIEQQSLLDD